MQDYFLVAQDYSQVYKKVFLYYKDKNDKMTKMFMASEYAAAKNQPRVLNVYQLYKKKTKKKKSNPNNMVCCLMKYKNAVLLSSESLKSRDQRSWTIGPWFGGELCKTYWGIWDALNSFQKKFILWKSSELRVYYVYFFLCFKSELFKCTSAQNRRVEFKFASIIKRPIWLQTMEPCILILDS